MPYIAVSAGLIHTTQLHLPRTVATVFNQGLGHRLNLKIRFLSTGMKFRVFSPVFFLPMTLTFFLLICYTAYSLLSHSPGRYKYDTNHMRISNTVLSSIIAVFLLGRRDDDQALRTAWDH